MLTIDFGSTNPVAPFALVVVDLATTAMRPFGYRVPDAEINGYWDSGERFDSIEDAQAFYKAECDESLNWVLVDEAAYTQIASTCGIEA